MHFAFNLTFRVQYRQVNWSVLSYIHDSWSLWVAFILLLNENLFWSLLGLLDWRTRATTYENEFQLISFFMSS